MRKLALALVIAIILVGLWGCAAAKKPSPTSPTLAEKGKPVKIVDSVGRVLEVPQPLKRIVVTNVDAAWTVWGIGAQDRVVGVPKYVLEKPYMKVYQAKGNVGSTFHPSYEKIMELEPQVVLAYVKWPGHELEEKLEPMGIKVVRLDFYNPGEMVREIKTLGLMLGMESEAERYADGWEEPIKLVRERLGKLKEKVKVYYEGSKVWSSCGPGSGYHDLVILAGGVNIAGSAPSAYPHLSPEYVLEANPDVIVKDPYVPGYGKEEPERLKEAYEELLSRIGIKETEAAKKGRVHVIAHDVIGGAFKNIGLLYLAKWFYPERFEDIDPAFYHQKLLQDFFNLEYKGIFSYP